jgi:hypothetical protein
MSLFLIYRIVIMRIALLFKRLVLMKQLFFAVIVDLRFDFNLFQKLFLPRGAGFCY